MSEDEIKANAPSGATHYYEYKNGNIIYFKYFHSSDTLYRMTPRWCATDYTIERIKPL